MDPDELVSALRSGDPSAGAFLISHYAPGLLAYAGMLSRDLSQTDRELLCETAVENAVRRIARYDPKRGPLSAWLRGFVRHEVLEWRRKRPSPAEFVDESIASPVREQWTEPPQKAIVALERIRQSLSEGDQIMIALRDIEGLSFALIGERLGVAESAVRQRHHRALGRLREAAEKDEELLTAISRPRR